MFSLLLCASLWQFDAPVPAGESPLTRMLNDRDDGWESRLQIEW
ncbi:hypothetical protein [Aeromonas allosaccharophila]